MSLSKCAPWIFEREEHVVSPAEADAVTRLFSSLSQAEATAITAKRDHAGWLPLHSIAKFARGRHSIEVFAAVLKAHPQAAKEKHSQGWLPLHQVARHMGGAAGLQAIRLLLAEYPPTGRKGSTARWMAAASLCSASHGRL
jgi:hypothetical protein